MTVLNITAAEIEVAKALSDQGRISEGWGVLAARGDAYAYLAQYVVMRNPEAETFLASAVAKLFRNMVRSHWRAIKGARFELIPTAPELPLLPLPRRPLGADFQYALGRKPLTAL